MNRLPFQPTPWCSVPREERKARTNGGEGVLAIILGCVSLWCSGRRNGSSPRLMVIAAVSQVPGSSSKVIVIIILHWGDELSGQAPGNRIDCWSDCVCGNWRITFVVVVVGGVSF